MTSKTSSTRKSSRAKGKKDTSAGRSSEWKKIEQQLARASKEKNLPLRGVRIAAAIASALRQIDQEPVLVGGAAVEFYSKGAYTTRDIDMVAPGGPELKDVMTKLGFERIGKDFTHKTLNVYIEFPAETLGAGERTNIIEVDGVELEIVSLEDLIIDRLDAYKFWKSSIDGVNAMILMELGENDEKTTERKARDNDVLDALDYVRIVRERVIRQRLPKEEASQLIEKFTER
jgi:predicted nucleotidyltransferase